MEVLEQIEVENVVEDKVAHVTTTSLSGIEGELITVEADLSNGLPALAIVGLADKAVGEARDRVRSAFKNSSLPFPQKKITVNLAPADLKKGGSSYDFAIAAAILVAAGIIPALAKEEMIIGELGLDGAVRRTTGIVPMLIAGMNKGKTKAFIPAQNLSEAQVVDGIEPIGVRTLSEFVSHVLKERLIKSSPVRQAGIIEQYYPLDMSDIKGQEGAKRALTIAAVGGHNIIFTGPPGTGKTMLARAFPSILPALTKEERLELTMIYSAAGLTSNEKPVVAKRPFRSPHHTSSSVSLIGGGATPKPGEATLAHRGVLFLDELPEFSPGVIESLRQPLEDKFVTVARAVGAFTFPSDFLLLAAQNPCPCGYLGDPVKRCRCLPQEKQRYRRRLSGPLLDRFDMVIAVPAVKFESLERDGEEKTSESLRKSVEAARAVLFKNFGKISELEVSELLSFLEPEAKQLIFKAARTLHVSARQYVKLLRVACSIAALDCSDMVRANHIAEALSYRYR